jgi:hypothetical protein
MSVGSISGFGNMAPNIFGSWAGEGKVMDGFNLITELAFSITHTIPFYHIIFSRNDIKLDQPEPNFNFEWNFGFPKVFERSVVPHTAKMIEHEFDTERSIFDPFQGKWIICLIG